MATGSISDVNFEKFNFDRIATSQYYIDKGAFGEVYGPFAWNRTCVFKRVWISAGTPGDDFKRKVETKKTIWTSVKHKNLIEIYDVILRPKALYIVMEYASGGSLRDLLCTCNPDAHRQLDVSNWARQIAEGMFYLHQKDVVHRDLKSGNIVLLEKFNSKQPREEMTLKITDFDEVKEQTNTATMSLKGTVAYMAPEVLNTERFSKASDVWSYGVVLWEMLTRQVPHDDLSAGTIMQKARTGQLMLSVPESIPKAYQELLRDCQNQDQKSRHSFEKINDLLKCTDNKEDKLQNEYALDPVLVHRIRTEAAKENAPIRGMTILDKELFVVSQMSSDVEVYDSTKFSLSRRWNLKELILPLDIVSCDRNKCLYIIDCKGEDKSSEILRVDPNGKLIKNWSTGDDDGFGLFVTDELNVILTVQTKSKLNEYSSDGELIREIHLSSDAGICHSWHAIKLTDGNFAVCHGDFDEAGPHGVCIVDADGNLKKSFTGTYGSAIRQRIIPVHLSVDGNGFLLVADCNNRRVLVLDSDLNFKREILSTEDKHGLRRPWRTLLDESNGRLFLADNDRRNKQILIFDLRLLSGLFGLAIR